MTYTDDRFQTPLPGTRLRDIPSQSRRGFPIYQPDQPACDRTAESGTVTVEYTVDGEQKSETVPVSDEAEVIQPDRVRDAASSSRIEKVAHLSWADEVTASGDGGKGSVGTHDPGDRHHRQAGPHAGHRQHRRATRCSPRSSGGVFNANLTITGDQPSQRVAGAGQAEPVRRARVRRVRQLRRRSRSTSTSTGSRASSCSGWARRRPSTRSTYAKASCGFLTSIGGGEG